MLKTRNHCPACGATAAKPLCGYEWTTAYRCASCSVVFLNPYIDHEGMKEIYASPETLGKFFPFCDHYFEDTAQENRGTRTFRVYERGLEILSSHGSGRKLLEVGCGAGQFLKLAVEKGWDAEGLEFDNSLEKKLKSEGLRVSTGDFLTADPPRSPYDAAALWDVFEHFAEPVAALKRLHHVLKPGGMLLLAVPKENSSLARLAEFFYKISGGRIQYPVKVVYLIDHPLFYSPKSLSRLLEANGFEVLKTEMDETDLRRVEFNSVVKLALKILFWVSRPFGLQNRMLVLARRKP